MFSKIKTEVDGIASIKVTGLGRYSLTDTLECGQCFRFEKKIGADKTEYVGVVKGILVDVIEENTGELIFVGASDEEADKLIEYFALDRNQAKIREEISALTDSDWLRRAAEYGEGIAILRQDPWEALVSFIISQNNNIPRIKKIVREISAEYGVNLCLQGGADKCPFGVISTTPCQEKCKTCGRCYTFPTARDILDRPEGLLPSKPGFRFSYILDAAEKVASGKCSLEDIKSKNSYLYTMEELTKIKGVGPKVASCTALFGFANLEAFPIDVWMKRAIDTYFDGKLDPEALGRYAGIAQQYIFHYIRNIEN